MPSLIAGNWKMHGLSSSLKELEILDKALVANPASCEVLICPPATLIARAATKVSSFWIGGQDCHSHASGASTGDISAEMLRDAGARAVIVGHSERRHYHGETNAMVAAKAEAAWRAGLMAVICIGETKAERDAGHAERVCTAQLADSVPTGATATNTVIAYEPVWAIGTGNTPTSEQIVQMHGHIRHGLGTALRILYGGSVKPSNAQEILSLPEVGGALVGGASLKAAEFLQIIRAAS